MSSNHAAEPGPLLGDGRCLRRMSEALISLSFARIRFFAVTRLSLNLAAVARSLSTGRDSQAAG